MCGRRHARSCARAGRCRRGRDARGRQILRSCDVGYRPACRARLPDRLQPVAQPGVERAMSDSTAPIVVSPGKVSLDDLAQVLAGVAVVLDPSFWPRVEAASAIVAEAATSAAPVFCLN